MPKAQKRRNPFTPGDGALPPYLAGREKEQAALLRMVQDVASGYVPPHNVLISAPRGNGKTVLLHWTAKQAQLKDWDAMRSIQAALQAKGVQADTPGCVAVQDAMRRIKHWGFAVPSADLAHWLPGIPSLMAHVQQRAEDAGVLPPQSSVPGLECGRAA